MIIASGFSQQLAGWGTVALVLITAYYAYELHKERKESKARDRRRVRTGLTALVRELETSAMAVQYEHRGPLPHEEFGHVRLLGEIGAGPATDLGVRGAYLSILRYNATLDAQSYGIDAHTHALKQAQDNIPAAVEAMKADPAVQHALAE